MNKSNQTSLNHPAEHKQDQTTPVISQAMFTE